MRITAGHNTPGKLPLVAKVTPYFIITAGLLFLIPHV